MAMRHQKRSRASDAADKPSRLSEERVKRRRTSDVNEAQESSKKSKNASPSRVTPVSDTAATGLVKHKSTTPWSFSRPVGGRYSSVSPVMTSDEAYLFIGLDTAVQVFSSSTSRLVRTLQMEAGQKVIGYKICPLDQEILYVFTSGFVTKWHWDSGKRLARWSIDSQITAVDVTCDGDVEQAVAYSVTLQKGGKTQILINALGEKKSNSILALETNEKLKAIQVAYGGRVIVACDSSRIYMGTTSSVDLENPGAVQYTWRQAVLPISTTCFDLRETNPARNPASEPKASKSPEAIDLVLGDLGGSILIYQDIQSTLFGRASDKKTSPRKLHWHRGSVNTVRWSKDGNYVISGGNESVIVLWQLDTGRKQFLPHLSSPIVNVNISPQGTSYVVQLADNSAIVLSARELQPSVTVTGLQISCEAESAKDSGVTKHAGPVAALHPQHPEYLLVAVPASQQSTQQGSHHANAAVLQTFNIRSNSHISRQALARTNATTLNVGPEGSPIVTPDIRNMDILNDGKWLATVDSWTPHPQDIEALSGSAPNKNTASLRPEIFLKFWRWNASSNLWELVTRVDGPHFNEKCHTQVLGLAARPFSREFATLGADASLRLWCLTARHRSGLKTDPSEQHLDTWKCRSLVDLTGFLGDMNVSIKQACMSFSEDGSVLAVCLPSDHGANDGLVLLVDVHNCTVHYRRTGAFVGTPTSAKFLGRYLVVASSESVTVWDTVDDVVKPAQLPEISRPGVSPLIAVNARTQTFAVVSRAPENSSSSRKPRQRSLFHIRIYDLSSLDLVFQETLPSRPVSLLSDVYSGDYIVLDTTSSVHRLGCLEKASQKNVQPVEVTNHLNSGLASIFSRGREMAPVQAIEGDHSSVQAKGLASVFGDTPSFSLPSLGVLFRNVVQTLGSS